MASVAVEPFPMVYALQPSPAQTVSVKQIYPTEGLPCFFQSNETLVFVFVFVIRRLVSALVSLFSIEGLFIPACFVHGEHRLL